MRIKTAGLSSPTVPTGKGEDAKLALILVRSIYSKNSVSALKTKIKSASGPKTVAWNPDALIFYTPRMSNVQPS